MDGEAGINAFAAGYDVSDSIVAVTRGTLETLNRDELQGVIGARVQPHPATATCASTSA